MSDFYAATADGHFISDQQQRIAAIIQDYDPTLNLVWIPTENRLPEDKDKEFAVVHRRPGHEPYIVLFAKPDEIDERLLVRLWTHDNKNGNVLDEIEARNAAAEAIKMRARMDAAEEQNDLTASIIGSNLHTYRHNGKVYQ